MWLTFIKVSHKTVHLCGSPLSRSHIKLWVSHKTVRLCGSPLSRSHIKLRIDLCGSALLVQYKIMHVCTVHLCLAYLKPCMSMWLTSIKIFFCTRWTSNCNSIHACQQLVSVPDGCKDRLGCQANCPCCLAVTNGIVFHQRETRTHRVGVWEGLQP